MRPLRMHAAAKLSRVRQGTAQRPPVMYSQPWSPTPSTTTCAPLLRTQNRSPATPRMYASPPVAPYNATLPTMMFSSDLNVERFAGYAITLPPDSPLPKPSFASPTSVIVMPRGMNAPKLCPADPVNVIVIVSSGSPAAPYRLVTSEPT